jgi:hypothetical protein
VRESNPPPRLERAVSSSARRTGVRFLSLPRREWAVWRSNPRLHLFRVALYRLSYEWHFLSRKLLEDRKLGTKMANIAI